MTHTATRFVREDIPNFLGNWGHEFAPRLYRLAPPMDGYEYVVVVVCDVPELEIAGTDLASGGVLPLMQAANDKTEVFASDDCGACVEIIPGFGLLPLRRWDGEVLTHTAALGRDGYEVVE